MKLNKIYLCSFTVLIISMLLITPIQPANAQFVIAGWDYPDEYEQGIELVWPYENSTGSWVKIVDPAFILSTGNTNLELNYSVDTAIKIIVTCTINHTLFAFGPDKSENASARAIMRVNITVTNQGESVFSQNNLTWTGSVFDGSATTWEISYEVVINVIIGSGEIYIIALYYEIYW